MRRSVFILLSALAVLPGCSTFLDTTHQTVEVTTPGVIGAECTLETKNNQYRVITPMKIQIQRTDDTLEVTCKKTLYYPAVIRVPSRNYIGKSAVTNVWNGFLPGVGYDYASESIYHYPDNIVVPMELDPYAVASGVVRAPAAEVLQKKPVEADLEPVAPAPQPAAETMKKALRK